MGGDVLCRYIVTLLRCAGAQVPRVTTAAIKLPCVLLLGDPVEPMKDTEMIVMFDCDYIVHCSRRILTILSF